MYLCYRIVVPHGNIHVLMYEQFYGFLMRSSLLQLRHVSVHILVKTDVSMGIRFRQFVLKMSINQWYQMNGNKI